ncbi:MAG: radical SAM protein [Clostridia bacterium]|nr:radical SAM protein [Clostridia bacterium]
MINYRTYSYEENEHLFGPGKRLLLFTQGCSLRCKGCVNQHLWEFGVGKNISTAELVKLCMDTDGVTLHGGEPLDQAEGLYGFVKTLKANGKTVVLFTGYLYKELNSIQRKIWNLSDIVVSGRYIEDKRNIYLQFRGSTNQRVYVHKGKYSNYKIKDGKTVAILRLSEDGVMQSRGFRTDEFEQLLKEIIKTNEEH